MPYPVIPSRRIPYDIDGTPIGYGSYYDTSIKGFLSPENISSLNSYSTASKFYYDGSAYAAFFFPELKEITHLLVHVEIQYGDYANAYIYGSTDTTNGLDGTWEAGVCPVTAVTKSTDPYTQRTGMQPVSFSGPVKVLKVVVRTASNRKAYFRYVHLYGMKYATETPDDLLFVDASTGDELTALTDWGDRPEGTTVFKQVKVKNASTTKTANNINLQLNHSDFLMSWNAGGPWTTVLDITSLGAGSESAPIYLKNELGPPNLTLGPKVDARIIASIGSWT